MNRTLKLSIMLALVSWGSQTLAQNLGPVQLHSTMDQPLVAEIPLSGVSGNLDNVHVALASEEAFARAGLNRAGLPVSLSFAVAKNAAGVPVIRVTSGAPVRDTYLDFLVEVSSGGNKAIREVTMLLDPPGTPLNTAAASGAPAAPSQAPAAAPSRTSDVPARVPSQGAARPARTQPAARPAAAAAAGTYGPVQRGQTLSSIARDHAGGADMNQMLVALQKANPDAFYRDNMNALKTGAILRIPSADEVQAQSSNEALAEVRRQNESWRAGTARAPSVVADAASTSAGQGEAKPKQSSSDRLAIVPSKEGGDAASTRAGSKGGTGDAQVAGLRQELATSQENVASLKQQGAELKSRIGELEDINAKNQRLLSLKDSEIAELQRKLAEAQKNGGATAANVPVATPAAPAAAPAAPAASAPAKAGTAASAVAATPAPAAGSTVTTAPLKEPAAAAVPPPAAKPAAKPVAKPAVVVPKPVEEDPWYMQPWAWGGGAIVILLLLVAAVFGRKKPKAATPVAAGSLADRFGEEPTFDFGRPGEAMDQDQREILDALAEHPDDIGLHLELVSLYYGRRDVDHFEAAAEAMFAHVADPDQPEWREVVMMGEDLAPTHPLFGGTPVDEIDEPYEHDGLHAGAHADTAAALEEFDLGNYVTGPEEDAHSPTPTPQKHSEYHFNFDLTPVQRAEADRRPNAPDVFDVDAPESPYVEAPAETPHASFGDILDGEKHEAKEEHSTWAFEEEHDAAATSSTGLPRFEEPTFPDEEPIADHNPESFSDDPVDTKLDLARAYLDMGDAEGARLMLDEVLAEGSQMQKDTARRILDDIA